MQNAFEADVLRCFMKTRFANRVPAGGLHGSTTVGTPFAKSAFTKRAKRWLSCQRAEKQKERTLRGIQRGSTHMMIRKMMIVPIAGAMFSGAFVSAQDTPQKTGDSPAGQAQADQEDSQAQQRQRDQQGKDNLTAQTGEHAKWQNPEQMMAACVAIDNQEEVALVNAVKDKLQHEEVKKFAAMLVQEHQDYLAKLEKFAPGVSQHSLEQSHSPKPASETTTSGTENQQSSQRDQTNKSGVEQARATNSANAPGVRQTAGTKNEQSDDAAHQEQMDVVQIQREIAQECLREAREEMGQKQGDDADKCFIGFQIAKHSAMKSKLTVLQRHASDELAQVFADGARTADQHKGQAIAIMAKLDGADEKPAATAPERRNDRREEREERREQRQENK